jgi:cytochrome P450
LNAGHETTTNLIGNALVALTEHPGVRAELLSKQELLAHESIGPEAYLIPIIDEFLRFESSNQLSNRRALKNTQFGGVDIAAGSLLTLCIGAANRDPAQFDQPNQLQLERQNNRHLAFGLGIHQCAGMSLARLEGRIAIGRFLQRFPNYRLTEPPTRGGRARFRGFLRAPFVVA